MKTKSTMLECFANRASWQHSNSQHGQMDILFPSIMIRPILSYLHLQRHFPKINRADQRDFNKATSKVKIEIDWFFGDIKNFFKFADFTKQLKIGMSAVGIYYLI